MTEGGKVSMPLIDVWMTKEEIADMFGLPEALVFRTIRSIYKKSELYEHETAYRIPFPRQESKGWTIDVYNLDLILYLTYKLPSRNARIFRKYMVNKAYERSPYEHICIIVDDVDFSHRSFSQKATGYNLHQTEERRIFWLLSDIRLSSVSRTTTNGQSSAIPLYG